MRRRRCPNDNNACILTFLLFALVPQKLSQSSGKHDQSSDKTFRRKEPPHSFPSQTPKNTMTRNILQNKSPSNSNLLKHFPSCPSNHFKPFRKPLLPCQPRNGSPLLVHGTAVGTRPSSTTPPDGTTSGMSSTPLWSSTIFGDVWRCSEISEKHWRLQRESIPQLSVDFEVIPPSRWSGAVPLLWHCTPTEKLGTCISTTVIS